MSLFLLTALCIAKVVSTDVKLLCSLSGKPDNQGKIDGQYTYKRNTEAPSPAYCCRGKAIRITFTECVLSAAIFIQHAKRVLRTVMYDLSRSAVFFDIIS
jgi:hypothetical protein